MIDRRNRLVLVSLEDGRVCVVSISIEAGTEYSVGRMAGILKTRPVGTPRDGEEAYTVTKPPHDRRRARPLSGSPANCLFSSALRDAR